MKLTGFNFFCRSDDQRRAALYTKRWKLHPEFWVLSEDRRFWKKRRAVVRPAL